MHKSFNDMIVFSAGAHKQRAAKLANKGDLEPSHNEF